MRDRPLPPEPHEDVVDEARAFLRYFASIRPAERRRRREDAAEVVLLIIATGLAIIVDARVGFLSVAGLILLVVAANGACALQGRVRLAVARRRYFRMMAEVAVGARLIDDRQRAIERQRLV